MKVLDLVLGRVDIFVKSIFQIKPSGLLARDSGDVACLPIGNGLFARRSFEAEEDLLSFVGEYIDAKEKDRRVAAKKDCYIIELTRNGIYLDCRSHCEAMLCYASYANDPFNCVDTNTGKNAEANCKLSVNQINKTCRLRATRRIKRGDEILWSYDVNGAFFKR